MVTGDMVVMADTGAMVTVDPTVFVTGDDSLAEKEKR